ncbi:MAG: GxxExxY protein [Bacillota bacterium]
MAFFFAADFTDYTRIYTELSISQAGLERGLGLFRFYILGVVLMGELVHGDVTKKIIGAAFEVHRTLGNRFLEVVYEEALCHELSLLGVPFERQVYVPIHYKGIVVGTHRLDLLVQKQVVVELKAVESIADIHKSIVLSYLAATQLPLAIIINFKSPSLEFKRVVR